MTSDQETSSPRGVAVCPECAKGDHSKHQPNLGGICIGCPCPEVVTGPPVGSDAPTEEWPTYGETRVPVCPRCGKEEPGPEGTFGAKCHYQIQARGRTIGLSRMRETNNLQLGQAALAYAIAGIPVHPLRRRSKVPATTEGVKDATIDLGTIRGWWNMQPGFNIGLACGAVFDALDVDVKGDAPGLESFRKIRAMGYISGGFAVQSTPTGGKHVLFAAGGGGNHASAKTGLDFRGRGGYIVGAPSIVEAGQYTWDFSQGGRYGATFDWDGALAYLDPERYAPQDGRRPDGRQVTPGRQGADLDGLVRFVAAASQGERNHSLYWAAARAHEKGLDTQPLFAAARSIGLSEKEAAQTIASAARARSRV